MAIHTEKENSAQVVIPELVYFTKTAHHEAYSRISPLRHEVSAGGKNVVVTGGGTGIGRAVAIAFTQAGAKSVSILGRREDRLKLTLDKLQTITLSKSTTFSYQTCDLRRHEQVETALDAIVKKVGQIDILVSNAGSLPDLGPLANYNSDHFLDAFALNVQSTLNAVQGFMRRSGPKPMILNINSCISHMSPIPMTGAYGVSKAANLKLMDYFATENPNLHIVNVQPGTVETEMSEKAGVQHLDQGEKSQPLILTRT